MTNYTNDINGYIQNLIDIKKSADKSDVVFIGMVDFAIRTAQEFQLRGSNND